MALLGRAVEPWPVKIGWCSSGPGCRICIAQSKAALTRLIREGQIHPDTKLAEFVGDGALVGGAGG